MAITAPKDDKSVALKLMVDIFLCDKIFWVKEDSDFTFASS